jgi:hypothetical protein
LAFLFAAVRVSIFSLVRFVGSFRWFVSLENPNLSSVFIEPEKLSIRVFAFLAERRVSQPFGVSIRSLFFSFRFVGKLEPEKLSIRVFAFLELRS